MLKRSLLAKIARLYYVEDYNQRAIAKRLNMSMASVSRALARAKDERIVEIRVHDSAENDTCLESALETRYGLRECFVVRTADTDSEILSAMANSLSDLFGRVLTNDEIIGVSWGETLRGVSDRLRNNPAIQAHAVPIIGAIGMVETGIYPNAIANSFASRLGGHAYLVNTPAVFDTSKTRISVESERAYAQVAELWENVRTSVVSVSGISEQDSIYRYNIFTSNELQSLRDQGVVCATNFDFLGANGSQVLTEIDDRMIKFGFRRLRELRNLIVVAFGAHKATPIKAALESGIVNVLITDQPTAERVLDQLQESPCATPAIER